MRDGLVGIQKLALVYGVAQVVLALSVLWSFGVPGLSGYGNSPLTVLIACVGIVLIGLVASIPLIFGLALVREGDLVSIDDRSRWLLRVAAILVGAEVVYRWAPSAGTNGDENVAIHLVQFLSDLALIGLIVVLSVQEDNQAPLRPASLLLRSSRAAVLLGGAITAFRILQWTYVTVSYSSMESIAIQNGSQLPPLWRTQLSMAETTAMVLCLVSVPYAILQGQRHAVAVSLESDEPLE